MKIQELLYDLQREKDPAMAHEMVMDYAAKWLNKEWKNQSGFDDFGLSDEDDDMADELDEILTGLELDVKTNKIIEVFRQANKGKE